MPSVDFAAVRRLIPIAQVLELLQFKPVIRRGQQCRGPCPLHGSTSVSSRSFSVDLAKNAFQCFTCGAKGNQLDLWSQARSLPIVDAAIELCTRMDISVPTRLSLASSNIAKKTRQSESSIEKLYREGIEKRNP